MSLDDLAQAMGGTQQGSVGWMLYEAEFKRRQTAAAERASQAAVWSLWIAAIAIVVGAVATAAGALLSA